MRTVTKIAEQYAEEEMGHVGARCVAVREYMDSNAVALIEAPDGTRLVLFIVGEQVVSEGDAEDFPGHGGVATWPSTFS